MSKMYVFNFKINCKWQSNNKVLYIIFNQNISYYTDNYKKFCVMNHNASFQYSYEYNTKNYNNYYILSFIINQVIYYVNLFYLIA